MKWLKKIVTDFCWPDTLITIIKLKFFKLFDETAMNLFFCPMVMLWNFGKILLANICLLIQQFLHFSSIHKLFLDEFENRSCVLVSKVAGCLKIS